MNSKKSEKITETIKCYEGARKNKLGTPAYPNKLLTAYQFQISQRDKTTLSILKV